MARKSRSNRRSADTSVVASPINNPIPGLLRPTIPQPVISVPLVDRDERFYTPIRPLPPRGPGGSPTRLTVRRSGSLSRARIRFANPEAVDICRKRKDRREVMFALRKSRKGSQSKRRKQKHYSGVSC